MTVFAGAFALQPHQDVSQDIKAALSRNVSRADKKSGTSSCSDQRRAYVVKWDSGAFGESAWQTSVDGSVRALAGDPILIKEQSKPDRQQQLTMITPSSRGVAARELAACRGSFAVVHYDASSGELRLATDAIGVRPIYYTVHECLLIFATALRILEAIVPIDKQLSGLGMIELCVFSFALADRTPYDKIKVLRESEMLIAKDGGVVLTPYRDWVLPINQSGDMATAAADIHAEFQQAVKVRAGNDARVYSFLSGGMDSRAIVATLVESGKKVEALNFSFEKSQDLEYASNFANEIADRCTLHCLPGGAYVNYALLAKEAMTALERDKRVAVDRPQFIWSGDGGSVGLGHVYMNAQMLEIGSSGSIDGMIEAFMTFNRHALPLGILQASARRRLPQEIFDSVRSEVNRYPVEDLGRRIYLFLLFNDQRRHLFKHFETIDQHGLEVLTPFYDAALLKKVISTPVEWGILHKLYASFFNLLPSYAVKTPWQTYPGHVPCPLPLSTVAGYQWTGPTPMSQMALRDRVKLSTELVRASAFNQQSQVFSMPRIWLAAILQSVGLRDCRHLLPVLQYHQRYGAIAAAYAQSISTRCLTTSLNCATGSCLYQSYGTKTAQKRSKN
jgi:asparagine synthase (glutamine-hydrolysing)